jgi:hypothetical protein
VDNIKVDLLEIVWGGVDWACSTNGAKRNAYRLFIEKPEGKRPVGRPRRRWVDNIKVDLLEIVWGGIDWACSRNGAKRNAYRLFIEKPEGRSPLGRPRRRWVDNHEGGMGRTPNSI